MDLTCAPLEAVSTMAESRMIGYGIGNKDGVRSERSMTRGEFTKVVEEVMDSLPKEFRRRIRNVAVLVEDLPAGQKPTKAGKPRKLLLGIFHGVPMTQKSTFQLPTGPDYVVLYQKNIEAISSSEAEVREQIRRTVIHEFGHYFGMNEEQLKDV